jgi:hypothetical protein
VAAVRTKEDPSGVSLLRRLPASTAQVIDPALYRNDVRPKEAKLDLAARLPGSTPVYATTLGAANLDLLGEMQTESELSRGWRGDRLEAVRQNGRVAVVWAVAFQEPAQSERPVRVWTKAKRSGAVAQQKGTVAVLLVGVPADRAAELAQLAGTAFR